MYALAIDKDAKADLAALLVRDRAAALEILAVLQEIEADQGILSSLSDDGYADGRIDVCMVRNLQRATWNIWRLKVFCIDPPPSTLPYRIIYAFDAPRGVYYVLAIMHRDQDYERDHQLIGRIQAAYERLGIYKLPRG
jgi:hypothetical protein